MPIGSESGAKTQSSKQVEFSKAYDPAELNGYQFECD